MSRKMRNYEIESSAGEIYGTFAGRTPQEAWERMVAEGGMGLDASGNPTEGKIEGWIVREVKPKDWASKGVKPRKR